MILKNRNYAAALTAYFLWGILPVYWKLLGGVEPMVVLAHRTVWSGFFILIYLLMNKKLLRGITAKSLMRCSISAIFLSLNWGTYIWAVGKGYILASSLGYFGAPLLYLVVGAFFFGERLSLQEKVATCFSLLALIPLIVASDFITCCIAFVLATSIVAYGICTKGNALPMWTNLGVEALLLSVPATGYLLLGSNGSLFPAGVDATTKLLLICAGPATMIPLFFYGMAIKALPMKVLGLMQYISPSLQFLLGAFVYGETIGQLRIAAFLFVWCGVSIVILSKLTPLSQRFAGKPKRQVAL